MAISEEIVTSLVEAVAALNLRVNDAASRPMIQGPRGEAGPKGERGDDAPPITDKQIQQAAENWLRENISQPADGKDGIDGKDGQQGRPPTDDEIRIAVEIWFDINRDTLRGPAGKDGASGRDGSDGATGPAGPSGMRGPSGANGSDGVGIALIEQRDEASFWITLTDGQEFEIELPKAKGTSYVGGGGGGIREITSVDGTVTISSDGSTVDLSVSGGTGPTTNVVAVVRNRTGSTIPKGTAVYISGATGQTSEISLAIATSDATSAQTLGLTSDAIANNQTGYVVSFGYISDVNTAAYTDGQQLYLSPTTAGAMTGTKPHAPAHLVYVAVVEYAHAIHGKLFVKVQNGYELDEIHDVQIADVADGDVIQYDAATDLWRNTALPQSWMDLVARPSTLAGSATVSGQAGTVRQHSKTGAADIYRFIPTVYDASLDGFYTTFAAGSLSGLIVTRG